MSMWVYDGASPFSLDAAKANGAVGITGYIIGRPGGYYPITKARVDQIRAKGMGFVPNWERAADAFLRLTVGECGQAGVESMRANQALGVPDGVRTYFSIDTQVSTDRFPEMAQKLDAAQAGMGGHYPAGLYGQSNLIDWLGSHPTRSSIRGKHWLMMSTWNQYYHADSPYVCMVQEHNLDGSWHSSPVPNTDCNLVTDARAIGAWWPDGSPYGGEVDMPLDATDLLKIRQEVIAALSDTTHSYLTDEFAKSNAVVIKAVNVAIAAAVPNIASAIYARLPPAATGGLSQDDVKTAVKAALAEGVIPV